MGCVLESTPEMGEYSVEVRRESFYLRGSSNFVWHRSLVNRKPTKACTEILETRGGPVEIADQDNRPVGQGWVADYINRRHAIHVRESGDTGQGTVEILLEDVPKIRAALDAIEAYERRRGTPG